MLLGGQEVMGW